MAHKQEFHAVPRDSHASELLASERTFLAWIRTSVAVLSFGFATIKLDPWANRMLEGSGGAPASARIGFSMGTLMVIMGGLMSAVGALHYRRTNRQILEDKVQAINWLVLSISAGVVLLSIAVIIYIVLQGEY